MTPLDNGILRYGVNYPDGRLEGGPPDPERERDERSIRDADDEPEGEW